MIQAFKNDPKLKEFYVNRMDDHAKADEIVQGKTWENGKGCFVGCTLHEYDHSKFPEQVGLPEWLARLGDTIFEGLTNSDAKWFATEFYKKIPVGAKLDKIKTPFLIFILEQNLKYLDECVFDKENNPDVVSAIEGSKRAIELTIEAHKGSGDLDAAWSAAESAAESAAWSAESAARSAWSAAWSARSAARSAWSAAESAAWSAESAARSAWSAAWSARSAARSAWSAAWSARSAAWSARSAAWPAAFKVYADKLFELFEFQKKGE